MPLMRKLHTYIGIGAAVIVIILSVTGILLVHRKSLGLDKITVRVPASASPQHPDAWDTLVLSNGGLLAATKQGLFLRTGGVWTRPLPQQVRRLLRDGSVIYAGGKQGLFASSDRGRTWEALLSNVEVKALRARAGALYVATPRAVLSARRDEPGRWKQVLAFGTQTLDVRDLIVTDREFLVVAKEGLFRSGADGLLRAEQLPLPGPRSGAVELQKLITDIHTGDFFGPYFFVLVDASAAGLVVLTITGLYVWYVPRSRRRKAQRAGEAR